MRKHIIGSGRFIVRKLEELRSAGEEAVAVRQFDCEVRAVDGEPRMLDFTISTDSVDRYGDTVAVDGWNLKQFKKNPVVLWQHNNSLLPVAKAANVRIEGGKLKARAIFEPEGLVPFNDDVFRMLKTGFLSATSVGFMPIKYSFVENDPKRGFGIDFLEQELLEFSIVTVPANADALIEGRSVEDVPEQEPEGAGVEIARRRLALIAA